MANDDTLPAENLPGGPAGPAGPVDAPPASWDRYVIGERLGEGGMGVVYKARDVRLDRPVAIKLIRGGNPSLTMRLVREARAQARIDHPGVCRVYEVGDIAGRAYIALQFVDGEPLGKAAARMTLDEKIAVVRDVAVAIHEAHRLGIVHRDIKPANVMVERGEDGRPQPIVMDFGIARETTLEVGMTETGALLGTPAYMSPEQARGGGSDVDRRSDVYSLGATLYELLVARPPFDAESLATALHQVLNEEPVAPRKVVPSVPVDLETITLKCLAKDPAERYPSARALADDLTRYLDGEPIEGRRRTLRQRLRSSVRRHRALYAVGAASSVLVLAAGAWGVRSYLVSRSERARTVERTQLAERLGTDAKDIELLLHTTYQLPLHDTRKERSAVRARMQAIASTQHDLGALGDAVVHDALGRGHLALHEWSAAVTELEAAEDGGLDTPELHAARGRALGELYHRAVEDARRSGDKTWLAARERELAAQYLTPALAELERGRGAADSSALLDAYIALYRRDFAAAKQRALAVAEASPWLYESLKLAADATYAAAATEVDRGSYDAARTQLDDASALYTRAVDAARSDADLLEAAAQARLMRADIDMRQGKVTAPPHDDARALIDRAITADPDDAAAYTTKAYMLNLRSRAKVDSTADRKVVLEQGALAGEKAVALDAGSASAWDAIGNVHISRGTFEYFHGGKGEVWWHEAVDELTKALAIRPNDPWANNDLGLAHRWLGSAAEDAGLDPMPDFHASLAQYRRATEIDPSYVFAWANQADLSAEIAAYETDRGADPSGSVADAVTTGQRGLAIDPSFSKLLLSIAAAKLAGAEYALATGGDPSDALVTVGRSLDSADTLQPLNFQTSYYRARSARVAAAWSLGRKEDATQMIAAARTALAEAERIDASNSSVYVERAELELLVDELPAAGADIDRARALGAGIEVHLAAAALELRAAQKAHDPVAVAKGLAEVDTALAMNRASKRGAALREKLAALR